MKSYKKRISVFIIICITILVVCISFSNKKKYEIVVVNSFTEQTAECKAKNEEDKEFIKSYLNRYYIEDKGFFVQNYNDSNIFEKLYSNYILLKECGNLSENGDLIMEMLHSYEYNIDNYNVPLYDYMYYVALKKEIGENVDNGQIKKHLNNFIDDKTGLIFYLSDMEDIDNELLLTARVANICNKYNIDISEYDFRSKVIKCVENYKFKEPDEKDTFFNSGGTIMYALTVLANDYYLSEKLESWCESWKKVYDTFRVEDDLNFIELSSYCQIKYFFSNKNIDKVKEYIKNSEFSQIGDTYLNYTDVVDYVLPEYKEYISNIGKKNIEKYAVAEIEKLNETYITKNTDIDIATTFYGCNLALSNDYNINFENCVNEVKRVYFNTENDMNDEDYLYNTYYFMMILCMSMEDYSYIDDSEMKKINSRLDEIIESLLSDENNVDITKVREALEIKSNMRFKRYEDIYVYEKEYRKIKEILENLKNGEKIYNSKIADALIIDYILQTKIFDKAFYDTFEDKLYNNGGFKCKEGEKPDIKTTYLFCTSAGNNGYLDFTEDDDKEIEAFIDSLYSNGIYTYENEDGYWDIRSVYYGYYLKRAKFSHSEKSLGGNNYEK